MRSSDALRETGMSASAVARGGPVSVPGWQEVHLLSAFAETAVNGKSDGGRKGSGEPADTTSLGCLQGDQDTELAAAAHSTPQTISGRWRKEEAEIQTPGRSGKPGSGDRCSRH